MLLDIDECSDDPSLCDHISLLSCVNEPGSYSCVCDGGYTLAEDLSACSGLFTSGCLSQYNFLMLYMYLMRHLNYIRRHV